MLINDEKQLWYNDLERLAEELKNKSYDEVLEVLTEEEDLVYLRIGEVESTIFQRFICVILFIPITLIALLASAIKKLITGDRYLNSWIKKLKLESFFRKYTPYF